jgi:hypothetical protein
VVIMTDNTSGAGLGKGFCRDDLPLVVEVLMRIARDLLALATDTTILVFKGVSFLV